MTTSAEPPGITGRYHFLRWGPAAYWLATAAVAAELGVGGIWDITRIPSVRELVTHLGYPSYFLVLLGVWKVLGAAALLVPRRALLKEWAYAGAFFTYTGAIVSHLATGYALSEVAVLAVMTPLTVVSWALRPPSRRTSHPGPGAPLTAAPRDTPGLARAIPVPGHAGETGTGAPAPRRRRRAAMTRTLSLILRNLAFTIVVPGLGGAYVPWLILTRHGASPAPAAWYATPAIAAGTGLYMWCVWNFAAAGGGTPGLWDAPRRVVATGPYRWMRNPIYLAALLITGGQAWLFLSLPLLAYTGALAVFFHLFVTGYEEPALSRRFGTAYTQYQHAVPRWIPRRLPHDS